MNGKNPTLLITGATGFLGSHLLNSLIHSGYQMVVLKRSHSRLGRIENALPQTVAVYDFDRTPLAEIFSNHRFDGVLHCATHYGRGDVPPQSLVEANLIMPLSLLHWSLQSGVTTFINTDTILDKRVNAYSLSKKQFLEWLHSYSDRMTCATVALEHFFGPGDDPTKFVTHLIRRLLSEEETIELTAGDQRRDFIFIDDVVQAFKIIIEFSLGQKSGLFSYEVGSGQNISIRNFVQKLKQLTGNVKTNLSFGAVPYRANEIMESKVNLTRLQALGWRSHSSLDEALVRTIEQEKLLMNLKNGSKI